MSSERPANPIRVCVSGWGSGCEVTVAIVPVERMADDWDMRCGYAANRNSDAEQGSGDLKSLPVKNDAPKGRKC